jgi:hypothetical protein
VRHVRAQPARASQRAQGARRRSDPGLARLVLRRRLDRRHGNPRAQGWGYGGGVRRCRRRNVSRGRPRAVARPRTVRGACPRVRRAGSAGLAQRRRLLAGAAGRRGTPRDSAREDQAARAARPCDARSLDVGTGVEGIRECAREHARELDSRAEPRARTARVDARPRAVAVARPQQRGSRQPEAEEHLDPPARSAERGAFAAAGAAATVEPRPREAEERRSDATCGHAADTAGRSRGSAEETEEVERKFSGAAASPFPGRALVPPGAMPPAGSGKGSPGGPKSSPAPCS